jgi:hypothetical protein
MDTVIPAFVGLLALMALFLILAFRNWRAGRGRRRAAIEEWMRR